MVEWSLRALQRNLPSHIYRLRDLKEWTESTYGHPKCELSFAMWKGNPYGGPDSLRDSARRFQWSGPERVDKPEDMPGS